jgi:hypothetical protein
MPTATLTPTLPSTRPSVPCVRFPPRGACEPYELDKDQTLVGESVSSTPTSNRWLGIAGSESYQHVPVEGETRLMLRLGCQSPNAVIAFPIGL